VQLLPYNETPNPGGVYKVWATLEANYLAGCAALGVSNGLDVVDCGLERGERSTVSSPRRARPTTSRCITSSRRRRPLTAAVRVGGTQKSFTIFVDVDRP
jgi:hypothetical protein